jgi:hypothetical protein
MKAERRLVMATMAPRKPIEYELLSVTQSELPSRSPLARKLWSFSRLGPGWSHGEGLPVSAETLECAEGFVELAASLQLRADVFPGLEGDCAVAFYGENRCVEVVIRPASPLTLDLHVQERRDGRFRHIEVKENSEVSNVVAAITALVPATWKLPAYSRSFNSTQSVARAFSDAQAAGGSMLALHHAAGTKLH